jgi:hypothetical protein
MLSEVDDVPREAGAARRDRFANSELEIAGLRADLAAMTWMQGITIGVVVVILINSFV